MKRKRRLVGEKSSRRRCHRERLDTSFRCICSIQKTRESLWSISDDEKEISQFVGRAIKNIDPFFGRIEEALETEPIKNIFDPERYQRVCEKLEKLRVEKRNQDGM
jgi:hypothetical protein